MEFKFYHIILDVMGILICAYGLKSTGIGVYHICRKGIKRDKVMYLGADILLIVAGGILIVKEWGFIWISLSFGLLIFNQMINHSVRKRISHLNVN